MAFDFTQLSPVDRIGNNRSYWHYFTGDPLSAVLADDYFLPLGTGYLTLGDVIEIVASSGSEFASAVVRQSASGHVKLVSSSTDASLVGLGSGMTLQAAIDSGALGGGGGATTTDGITDFTAAGRAIVRAADDAAQRAALGLGTAAQQPATAFAASTHSHVAADVPTLDALRAPVAALSLASQRITNLGTPTSTADAATKAYVDAVAQGLSAKASCRAATTANITLSGAQTIDGVSVVAADRVLVKNQTTTSQNGIYVAAAGAWSRATDMDTWAETQGAFTLLTAGTTQANTGWVSQTVAGGTLDTTSITFAQFSAAGGSVSSVNSQTGAVTLTQDNVADGTTAKQYTATEKTKLAGIAAGAQVNPTNAAIESAYNAQVSAGLLADISGGVATIRRWTGDIIRQAIQGLAPGASGAGNTGQANGAVSVAMTTTEAQIGTASITPSSATAKVLVIAQAIFTKDATTTARTYTTRVRRGTLNSDAQVGRDTLVNTAVSGQVISAGVVAYVDSPATASAVTYSVRGVVSVAGGTATAYTIQAVELPASGVGGQNAFALSSLTGATSRTVEARFKDRLSVKEFGGAVGDGVADDTAAIQAAIDAVKGTVGTMPHDKTRAIFLPAGLYKITAPVILYPGLTLYGEGDQSRLVASGTWTSGRGMVELADFGATYAAGTRVEDVGFQSAVAGVWAVKSTAASLLNSSVKRVQLNTVYGINLGAYAQGCVVEDVHSSGNIEQLLYLKGNWNHVTRLDKESGTGTSSEAYVELANHSVGTLGSHGNTFGALLIEGDFSSAKVAVKITGAYDTRIDSLWVEAGAGSLANVMALDGARVRIGQSFSGFPQWGVSLANGSSLRFDQLDINRTDLAIADMPFTFADVASHVDIGTLVTRHGYSNDRKPQVRVEKILIAQNLATPVTGILSEFEVTPAPGENMLSLGGSFESAADADSASGGGWIFPTSGNFSSKTYPASDLVPYPGHMFVGIMSAAGNFLWRQTFSMPAGSVGRRLEVAGWAKVTGSGSIAPYFSGCGLSAPTAYSTADAGKGWCWVRVSAVILSAPDTLNIGLYLLGGAIGDTVYLDEFKAWLA